MPQEELGYVELEWTCKNCGTRNPGTNKYCKTCGAPMGAQGKFDLPAQQELIKDADTLKTAQAGPDIICPFCGTRNAGNATSCKQCGGDLKGAKARAAGGVLGVFDDKPQADIKCPNCGTMNPASAEKCSNCGAALKHPAPAAKPTGTAQTLTRPTGTSPLVIGGVIAVLILCAVGAYFLFFRTASSTGTVSGVTWQRTIAILGQTPVQAADWQNVLPVDATVTSCSLKPRRFSNTQEPNSTKVCGTPYVVDQGNGTGKAVQDCQYQVSEQYCSYTHLQWTVINTIVARGTDLQPNWAPYTLKADEKEGNRAEEYHVMFDAGGKQYTYTLSNPADFARFAKGSRWNLKINGLGDVVDATPAQ